MLKTQLFSAISEQGVVTALASAAHGPAGQASDKLWYHSMQLNIENSPGGISVCAAANQRAVFWSSDPYWPIRGRDYGVQGSNHSRAVITLNNIEDHQGNSTEY